jgi:hypothetical protein
VWTCAQCGTGWRIRENGRWGRDGHDLLIEVPRLDKRFSLERCRAEAQMAARSQGFSGPPDEVSSYDGTPTAMGGPLTNPQGYVFTWYAPGSEEVIPATR